jgi:hypothetical protein
VKAGSSMRAHPKATTPKIAYTIGLKHTECSTPLSLGAKPSLYSASPWYGACADLGIPAVLHVSVDVLGAVAIVYDSPLA